MEKTMENNQTTDSTTDQTPVEDKQTNRVFTQSEYDARITKETADLNTRLKELGDFKTKYDELLSKDKEREQAEMSELEKATSKLTEQQQIIEDLTSKTKKYELDSIKSDVLSDNKYKDLPKAYRKLIPSIENRDELVIEADKALETFNNDFKLKTGKDIGAPTAVTNVDMNNHIDSKTMAEKIKSQISKLKRS